MITIKQGNRSKHGTIFDILANLSPPGRCASEWQQGQKRRYPAAFEAGYNACKADLLRELHGQNGVLEGES